MKDKSFDISPERVAFEKLRLRTEELLFTKDVLILTGMIAGLSLATFCFIKWIGRKYQQEVTDLEI